MRGAARCCHGWQMARSLEMPIDHPQGPMGIKTTRSAAGLTTSWEIGRWPDHRLVSAATARGQGEPGMGAGRAAAPAVDQA